MTWLSILLLCLVLLGIKVASVCICVTLAQYFTLSLLLSRYTTIRKALGIGLVLFRYLSQARAIRLLRNGPLLLCAASLT